MPDSLPGWESRDRQIRPSGRENGTDIIIFGSQNLANAASALSHPLSLPTRPRTATAAAGAARETQCSPGGRATRTPLISKASLFPTLPVQSVRNTNTPTDRQPPANFPRAPEFQPNLFEVGPEVNESHILSLPPPSPSPSPSFSLGPCLSSSGSSSNTACLPAPGPKPPIAIFTAPNDQTTLI